MMMMMMKMMVIVGRITASVTNLSRSKIQCCKFSQHVAQSRLEFYFLQQTLANFNACDWLSRSGAKRQTKQTWRTVKASVNSEYRDLEGYHSLWDTSFVPSKQAAKKAKGFARTVAKIQLFA